MFYGVYDFSRVDIIMVGSRQKRGKTEGCKSNQYTLNLIQFQIKNLKICCNSRCRQSRNCSFPKSKFLRSTKSTKVSFPDPKSSTKSSTETSTKNSTESSIFCPLIPDWFVRSAATRPANTSTTEAEPAQAAGLSFVVLFRSH